MTESTLVLVVVPGVGPLALTPEALRAALARGLNLLGQVNGASNHAAAVAPQTADETLLDAAAASKVLGVSVATVLRQARAGTLPCVRIGRYRKFRRSALLNGHGATDCLSARGSQGID